MSEAPALTKFSIIIPTYNREHLLAKALAGYIDQTSTDSIDEILVIDDGSTDGTELMVRRIGGPSPFPIRYIKRSNQGPAAARNVGIQQARSGLLLFSDSDIVPSPDLVEQHYQWHRDNPQPGVAVLGHVRWSPEVVATPFMRWYGEHQLFTFGKLRRRREVDFNSFYTCNVSVKAGFLRTCGRFDEEFKSAAYEDTEFGYRLQQRGMRLLYNPQAIAYHYQFFSFDEACRKTCANSDATRLFLRKQAGQEALKKIEAKRSLTRYQVATRIAALAAKALSPIRPFLDSDIPLPGMIYRLFFWACTRDKDLTSAVISPVSDAHRGAAA